MPMMLSVFDIPKAVDSNGNEIEPKWLFGPGIVSSISIFEAYTARLVGGLFGRTYEIEVNEDDDQSWQYTLQRKMSEKVNFNCRNPQENMGRSACHTSEIGPVLSSG
ncbi:hypothetical protein L208DRAFT_1382579 [Tricholoma matsutake]|nr:hypothetical protein L208DRAFT_1382579 [Tricholoma matsutake 945]